MPHSLAVIGVTIDKSDVAIAAAMGSLVIAWFSVLLAWRADRRAGAIERRTRQAELAFLLHSPAARGTRVRWVTD